MKIDSNPAGFDPSLNRVEQAKVADTAATDATRKSADQIQLSPEAQLANDAVRLAGAAPDIRPDAVERAKLLLDGGLLGSDSRAIADALIKSALVS